VGISSTGRTDQAPRLGIVGGGQLGMMLCRAAHALGVPTTVLTADPTAPAVHVADDVMVGRLDDQRALDTFIGKCHVATFELEGIPDFTLERLAQAQQRAQISVHPDTRVLALLRDKGHQKAWLMEQALPTLPFALGDEELTPETVLQGPIGLPLVQKARRGGYDGKGVQILRTVESLQQLWPVPSVIEPALQLCTEVSVIVVRNTAGRMRAYPPVSMSFDPQLNAVRTVTSPAEVDTDVQLTCQDIARSAVSALGAAGVFAVELFVTTDKVVYINEISPRVHNSGHLTIEAFEHDQFEQHVRAVMGLPLAPVAAKAPAAVMLNLLYEDSLAPAARPGGPYRVSLHPRDRCHLHWYGKFDPYPGRKVGHMTALGISVTAAARRTEAALVQVRRGNIPVGDQSLTCARPL